MWRWSEVKACEISKAAYDRGYGTRDEVVSIDARPRGMSTYFSHSTDAS